jgi:hypothetical protein
MLVTFSHFILQNNKKEFKKENLKLNIKSEVNQTMMMISCATAQTGPWPPLRVISSTTDLF